MQARRFFRARASKMQLPPSCNKVSGVSFVDTHHGVLPKAVCVINHKEALAKTHPQARHTVENLCFMPANGAGGSIEHSQAPSAEKAEPPSLVLRWVVERNLGCARGASSVAVEIDARGCRAARHP